MKHLIAIILAASISLGGCVCLGAGWVYEFGAAIKYIQTASPVVISKPYYISAWVNTTSASAGTIVWNGNSSSGSQYEQLIINAAGLAQVNARGTANASAFSTTVVNDGEWHYVVAVFSSTSSRSVYIDGVLEAEDTTAVSMSTYNRTRIGYMGDSTPANAYNGDMSGVFIKCAIPTAAEIRGLYKAGGGRNDFGALSIVLPRADDQSLVFSLDRPVTAVSTGDVLATDAVITSKDAARNYGLAKGGVTVGPAAIATPAP